MIDASLSEVRAVIERIGRHSQSGETLGDTFDRLMRDRDVARYDRSVVENAKTNERNVRILLAAAILSSPNRMIRITRLHQQAMKTPDSRSRWSFKEGTDLATGDTLLYMVDNAEQTER